MGRQDFEKQFVRLLKEVQIADPIFNDFAEMKLPCREIAEHQIGLTKCHLPNEKAESRLNFLCR
jgi:primosomal protein N''